jgi:hypothetical protein
MENAEMNKDNVKNEDNNITNKLNRKQNLKKDNF